MLNAFRNNREIHHLSSYLFLPKKKRATLLTELIADRLKIGQPTQFREQIKNV